mgnify:CR=1 FL=1
MRLTVVDTLSTIFFFTILAAVTELYVAGMEPAEVLKTRAVMIPMMILTGRPGFVRINHLARQHRGN